MGGRRLPCPHNGCFIRRVIDGLGGLGWTEPPWVGAMSPHSRMLSPWGADCDSARQSPRCSHSTTARLPANATTTVKQPASDLFELRRVDALGFLGAV